jgi:hypothetical protein
VPRRRHSSYLYEPGAISSDNLVHARQHLDPNNASPVPSQPSCARSVVKVKRTHARTHIRTHTHTPYARTHTHTHTHSVTHIHTVTHN